MVSNIITVRRAIAALAIGAVLIMTGMVLIAGARHTAHRGFAIGSADGIFVYYVWDVLQLAAGIALALAGASSLTYLMLTRRKKGV